MNWTEFFISGHLSAIWPLILLPAAAAWICDRVARTLEPTHADWRTAAALAGFPGMILLIVCLTTIGRALFHLHPDDDWGHFLQYRVLPVLSLLILARGLGRLRKRRREVRSVTALAVPASRKLQTAATAMGVRALELPVRSCECFVAGFRSPMIYISSAAVEKLSDAELRAVLCHERAHAAGRDPAVLTILTFLADIAPASERAMDAYCQARERIADQEAARATSAIDVASALLVVARQSANLVPAVGMAASAPNLWRIHALFGEQAPRPSNPRSRFLIAGALTANASLAASPLVQVYLAHLLVCGCALQGTA